MKVRSRLGTASTHCRTGNGGKLMTMKGVAPPEVTMLHIFRAVVPYVLMSILLLALVFWFPVVATWLPQLIG